MARILVVEDERVIASSIAGRLHQLGHTVNAIVDSGKAAIQQAAALPTDLVIMDIVLQGEMSGIEAAKFIQNDLQIPVVYLTAYGNKEILDQALQTEPYGYILKPFRLQAFDGAIGTAIARAQSEGKKYQELETLHALWRHTENLNDAKTRYVAVTTQEFHIPLAIIETALDALEQQGDRAPLLQQQCLHLKRIRAASKTMGDLLALLKESHHVIERLSLEICSVDVVDWCRQIIELIQIEFNLKNKICFSSQYTTFVSSIDEILLQYILSNLLVVASECCFKDEILNLDLSIQDDEIILSVEIHLNMTPNFTEGNLFESVHNSRRIKTLENKSTSSMTGLRWAIAKRCVDLHQGTLIQDNDNESKRIFTIALPIFRQNDKFSKE